MTRKLVIGLVTAGLFLAGFGGAVLPAGADPHHYLLKLANGTTVPWTGEPGSAPGTITVAGVAIPMISVQDLGAVVQQVTPPPPPTPAPAPAPTATTTTPAKPTTTTQPKATHPESTTPQSSKSTQPSSSKPSKKASQAPTGGTQTQQATNGAKVKQPQVKHEASKKPVKKKAAAPKPAKKKSKDDAGTAAPPPAAHTPPAPSNPTFSLAQPGAAAVGVPNFFIDKFRIPPFLLPIYQAAGVEY